MNSPDAEKLLAEWLAVLRHHRRLSPHTLRAYTDDATRFVEFLSGHGGGPVTIDELKGLRPADVRAFITVRRSQGLGARGVQRAMAAVRSFYRHLERANLAGSTAVNAVRSPKIPHNLPRPLSEHDALRVIGEAAGDRRK